MTQYGRVSERPRDVVNRWRVPAYTWNPLDVVVVEYPDLEAPARWVFHKDMNCEQRELPLITWASIPKPGWGYVRFRTYCNSLNVPRWQVFVHN